MGTVGIVNGTSLISTVNGQPLADFQGGQIEVSYGGADTQTIDVQLNPAAIAQMPADSVCNFYLEVGGETFTIHVIAEA